MPAKRRLVYLSTINLSLNKAQSIQVKQVVKSLTNVCKGKDISFKAFSYFDVNDEFKQFFKVFGTKTYNNRVIINLKMIYFLFTNNHLSKFNVYYSRDLLTVFIISLFGFKSLYEFHHPTPFLNTLVFVIYNKLPNTKLITISNALKTFTIKKFKLNKKDIKVLPSCVDFRNYLNMEDKLKIREKVGMKNDTFYVLHTGSPYKGRGVELFIRLCKAAKEIIFIHIGGTHEEISILEDTAKENSINNYKLIPSLPQKKIIEYQIAADLLFYVITNRWPTYWCCSPMKIPEYMASGTPILASSIGSITEILDQKTAFLFDADGVNMVDVFLKTISNPEICKEKALFAKKKVQSRYTWDIRSELLIEFIRQWIF